VDQSETEPRDEAVRVLMSPLTDPRRDHLDGDLVGLVGPVAFTEGCRERLGRTE